MVFRIEGAPWIPDARPGYEDWYLVEGSSALDPLNEAAVSGICKEPHDRVAQRAGGGVAGLYRLRRGEPKVVEAHAALWLAKPKGTGYQDFYEQLRAWMERSPASLWGRQMVLGPTPEFCLLARDRLEPPPSLSAVSIKLELLWAS